MMTSVEQKESIVNTIVVGATCRTCHRKLNLRQALAPYHFRPVTFTAGPISDYGNRAAYLHQVHRMWAKCPNDVQI